MTGAERRSILEPVYPIYMRTTCDVRNRAGAFHMRHMRGLREFREARTQCLQAAIASEDLESSARIEMRLKNHIRSTVRLLYFRMVLAKV